MPRLAPLALLVLALPVSSHGWVWLDDPREFHLSERAGRLTGLKLQVRSMTWQGPGRARSVARPPRVLELGQLIEAPAGEWTELVITLDGPARIAAQGEDGRLLLVDVSVNTLVIALDTPTEGEAGSFVLDLQLPSPLPSEAGWRGALQDGLLVVPAE